MIEAPVSDLPAPDSPTTPRISPGAIFQDPLTSLNPLYTIGRQLIETIQTHLPLSDADARARAIKLLEETGIQAAAQRVDQYPHQFSGGMRQRVVIALALAAEPRLIVADEPTTALDVSIQAQIIQLLKRLCREHGAAVMLVTHDMGVIAEMADDVVVMYLGREVEKGPVDEIFHSPKHPYTRALLRSIPSIMAEPGSRLLTISGSIPHPYNRPKGCPFHPRCPDFMPGTCDRTFPGAIAMGARQEVSCFLYPADRPAVAEVA